MQFCLVRRSGHSPADCDCCCSRYDCRAESQDLNGNKVTLDGLSDSGKFILEGAGLGLGW